MKKYFLFFILSLLLTPLSSFAADTGPVFGKVIAVKEQTQVWNEDLKKNETVQMLEVQILQGGDQGGSVTVVNDYLPVKLNQKVYIAEVPFQEENGAAYTVVDVSRRGALLFFFLAFVAAVVFFGGRQGVRSIASLGGSIAVILLILLPALLAGYSPTAMSLLIGVMILVISILWSHGLNKTSFAALSGTLITLVLAVMLSRWAVVFAQLTGSAQEEAMLLNIGSSGSLNFQGLLFAAILIGTLGVLDDIALTQAATVRELSLADEKLSRKQVYKKAIAVGKDHVSALVNTLALAYAGAALPLLLLITQLQVPFAFAVNREIIATELVRTFVGSIAIIACVPITTWIATKMFVSRSAGSDGDHS